ncbi:MAG: hypothetical protein ABXS91_01600 [Sulfurimonas sp.]
MAKLSDQERDIKLEAAKEAFESLKEQSLGNPKNLATPEKIAELANESEKVQQFKKKLGVSTIKQPKSKGFIDLKKAIDEFRNTHKSTVKTIPNKSKEQISALESQLEDSLVQNVKLADEIETLIKRLANKEKALDDCRKQLNLISEKWANYERKQENL